MTSKSYLQRGHLYQKVVSLSGGNHYNQYPWWYDTAVGADNPGFRQTIAKGLDATNSYDRYSGRMRFYPFKGVYRCMAYPHAKPVWWDGLTESCEGIPNWGAYRVPYAAIPSSIYAEALGFHNSKFEDWFAPFKGFTFLGELKETVSMIKGRSRSIFNGMMNYSREANRLYRRINSPRKFAKELSSMYLEYTFGWVPLANDIKTFAHTIAEKRPKEQIIVGYAKTSSTPRADYNTVVAYGGQGLGRARVSCKYALEASCRVVSCCSTELLDPSGAASSDLFDRFGLTAREFVPTAWELLPYSFLVDYFVNIGNIIQGCFVERKLMRFSYRTELCKESEHWNWINLPPASSYNMYGETAFSHNGALVSSAKRFRRRKQTSYVPPLEYGLPGFGSTKYLNMAALLAQRIKP